MSCVLLENEVHPFYHRPQNTADSLNVQVTTWLRSEEAIDVLVDLRLGGIPISLVPSFIQRRTYAGSDMKQGKTTKLEGRNMRLRFPRNRHDAGREAAPETRQKMPLLPTVLVGGGYKTMFLNQTLGSAVSSSWVF